MRNYELWISQTLHAVDENVLYLFLYSLMIYMWKKRKFNYRTKPKRGNKLLMNYSQRNNIHYAAYELLMDFRKVNSLKTHFYFISLAAGKYDHSIGHFLSFWKSFSLFLSYFKILITQFLEQPKMIDFCLAICIQMNEYFHTFCIIYQYNSFTSPCLCLGYSIKLISEALV